MDPQFRDAKFDFTKLRKGKSPKPQRYSRIYRLLSMRITKGARIGMKTLSFKLSLTVVLVLGLQVFTMACTCITLNDSELDSLTYYSSTYMEKVHREGMSVLRMDILERDMQMMIKEVPTPTEELGFLDSAARVQSIRNVENQVFYKAVVTEVIVDYAGTSVGDTVIISTGRLPGMCGESFTEGGDYIISVSTQSELGFEDVLEEEVFGETHTCILNIATEDENLPRIRENAKINGLRRSYYTIKHWF